MAGPEAADHGIVARGPTRRWRRGPDDFREFRSVLTARELRLLRLMNPRPASQMMLGMDVFLIK